VSGQFTRFLGYLPGGNDVHTGCMTVPAAKDWCEQHADAVAFTFNWPLETDPNPDQVVTANFKSVAATPLPGTGWHTYVHNDNDERQKKEAGGGMANETIWKASDAPAEHRQVSGARAEACAFGACAFGACALGACALGAAFGSVVRSKRGWMALSRPC
jgi:hypothetical protein